MIAIVDFKAGNLASVKKAFDRIGADSIITSDPDQVRVAAKIVLPGVGHFGATQMLEQLGLRNALMDSAQAGRPLLGICVGMQWLYSGSEEAKDVPGAGLIAGDCSRFAAVAKCPHVGWNTLKQARPSNLLRNIPDEAFVYFTHSYRAPLTHETIATCDYGCSFSAAVERQNIFGVQFHPEKSGEAGLQILRNFIELPC